MRVLFLLPLFVLAPLAAADDRDEAAEAEKLFAAEIPRWKFTAGESALDNPKEPVLRWTNPEAGRVNGNTYLWLHDGRPVAVGSLFRNFHPWNTFNGELAALTDAKVVAKRDETVMWQPKAAWKWHPIPGAPAPAAAAGPRLIQMKALASEFAVELLDTRTVKKGDEQVPRLLPKPLVRYDLEKNKKLDGALFAFVLGTDPELLLLFECDTTAEKPEWRFGAARMNRDAIRLKHKDKAVWEAESFRKHQPDDPYYFFGLQLPRKEPNP